MSDLRLQTRAGFWPVVLLVPLACGGAPVAHADVFELSGGGQLQGEWLNRGESSTARYEMRTTQGVHIVLDKVSVVQARDEVSVEQQYLEVTTRHGQDVAGQWAVAEWCREHGLDRQRRQHLQRILELEPDHLGARRALGYSQVSGRWVTREESMRERGYVLYRGKWYLSQQVELMERQRRRALAERQWYRQLLRWRRDLSTEHGGEVRDAILAVRDPCAVPAVNILLHQESARGAKMLWIHTLANIRTPQALDVLVDVVLLDRDLEVVHGCLDCLADIRSPVVQQRLQESLRHEHNECVNRAGLALGRLGQRSAIDSLIDALITRHVVSADGRTDRVPVQVVVVQVRNLEVLSALSQLAGTAAYGYDQRAWKQWRFLQNKQAFAEEAAAVDQRRNE